MPKLLLVDDDEAVIDYMRAKLGSRYTLVSTTSPEEVMALARQELPDLIVCDIDMPGLDGGDISARFFADEGLRDLPILFVTSLASPEDLRRSQGQLGGRPALSKQAPVQELVARIDALLQAK